MVRDARTASATGADGACQRAPHHEAAALAQNKTARARSLRSASNLLCLWGLCGKATCHRARTCRGAAPDCVARYAPLAPEDVRLGVALMLEARRCGLSYDAARADATEEFAAVERWIGLVHAAMRHRPPPPMEPAADA
jgi:hypothetical protein